MAISFSSSVPASAGALVSTANDLSRWLHALMTGNVLGKASLEAMSTAARVPGGASANPYGLGLYIWQVRGQRVLGHTGQINGFASFVAYVPSREITLVVLSNDDTFDAQTMGRRLAAIVLGKPYDVVAGVQLSVRDQRALTGRYKDGDKTFSLSHENGRLYYQREAGKASLLQVGRDQRLYFDPDDLSYFVPVRAQGRITTALRYFHRGEGPAIIFPRLP